VVKLDVSAITQTFPATAARRSGRRSFPLIDIEQHGRIDRRIAANSVGFQVVRQFSAPAAILALRSARLLAI
jgi:hypothetical protein